MKSLNKLQTTQLTPTDGTSSYFFGFHDICQFDASGRYILALRTNFLDRPPNAQDNAQIVVCDTHTGLTEEVDETTSWNFPQGARQQWWPEREKIHVYNKTAGGQLIAVAKNLKGEIVGTIPGGVYSFTPNGNVAFSLDFARLHHLGGYGYASPLLSGAVDPCPENDGIWSFDTKTGQRKLMVSVARVADTIYQSRSENQYLTHILPSPGGQLVCFLHRNWLKDGGVHTAVCVCAPDGSGLRLIARGFYSHFDWVDDKSLLIWGRPKDRLIALRSKHSAIIPQLMRLARPIWRVFNRQFGSRLIGHASYLLLDIESGASRSFLPKQLTEDGHPSFTRSKAGLFITDTYPDKTGKRNLFIVSASSGEIHDLGQLGTPQLSERREPEKYLLDIGVGAEAIERHGAWRYFCSRSGYSCDFHPRFDRSGSAVTIDSLHSGTRQVYKVDVSNFI